MAPSQEPRIIVVRYSLQYVLTGIWLPPIHVFDENVPTFCLASRFPSGGLVPFLTFKLL